MPSTRGWLVALMVLACSSPERQREQDDSVASVISGRGGQPAPVDGQSAQYPPDVAASADTDGLTLRPTSLSDERLAMLLAYGRSLELRSLPYAQYQHGYARLVWLPFEGLCVERSHMICGNRYYLLFSDGSGLSARIYEIGDVGEIDSVAWVMPVEGQRPDYLDMRTNRYPADVYKYQPDLPRRERWYRLTITPDSVVGVVMR